MNITFVKLTTALLILAIALVGGMIPVIAHSQQKRHSRTFLIYADFFAHGIILGAGLVHLLPNALNDFNQVLPEWHYPFVFVVCALTVFAIQFIEQGIVRLHYHTHGKDHTSLVSYLFFVLLSVHSLIEGAALGVSAYLSGVVIIFIAIIAHKGAESFALSINMLSNGIERNIIPKVIALFSLITPIGIFLGSALHHYLQSNPSLLVQGIFSSIAAGTFIYISSQIKHYDGEGGEYDDDHHPSPTKILCFGLGIIIMGIAAIWL